MTRKMHVCVLVILAATFVIPGCNSDKKSERSEDSPPAGGATPQEALINMIKATDAEDPEMIKACVYVHDDAREYFEITMLETMKAMDKFNKAIEEAYGIGVMGRTSNLPPVDQVDKLKFTLAGDTATTPGKYALIKLIQKDGRWFYDLSDKIPPASERKLYLKEARATIKAVETVMPKIGTRDYTHQKIMDEFTKVRAAVNAE